MTKDLATAGPSLRKVLEMDADRKSAVGTIPIIRELIPVFKEAGTLAEVGLAALVYSLANTKVLTEDAEVVAKWQLVSLAKDKKGEWLPFSRVWADFCYVHLGLDPSTASRYRRVWEVYHVNLGYDLDDLLAAGIHKLKLAASTVSWLYPTIDLPLVEALFGNPDKCANCGIEVGGDVGTCSSCGEVFEPMPGGSVARVDMRVRQLREKEAEGLGAGYKFLPNVRAVVEGERVVGWEIDAQIWHEGVEGVSYLPAWPVSIIEDGAAKDEVGVRTRHVNAFRAWLGRHFG